MLIGKDYYPFIRYFYIIKSIFIFCKYKKNEINIYNLIILMETIIIKTNFSKDTITIMHKKKSLIPLPKKKIFKSSLELIYYSINNNK